MWIILLIITVKSILATEVTELNYCYVEGDVQNRVILGTLVSCNPLPAICTMQPGERLLTYRNNIECMLNEKGRWFLDEFDCAHRLFSRRNSCKNPLTNCYQVMMECFPKKVPTTLTIIVSCLILLTLIVLLAILTKNIFNYYYYSGTKNIEIVEIEINQRNSKFFENTPALIRSTRF